ncbi:MAG: acetolactate decarboxylase [Verrucomicrobiota bacterium]
MVRNNYLFSFVALTLAAACFAKAPHSEPKPAGSHETLDLHRNCVTQVSSYNGLLAGLYDGSVSFEELRPYGNFGLGTFDKLDGELYMIDGVIYQIDYDGKVHEMPYSATTPYITMANFQPDQVIDIPEGLTYDEVSKFVEKQLPNINTPYAIQISGTFKYMKCRSIPKQNEKPYPSLADITKVQSIFEQDDVKGSLVGFYYPQYASTLNPPGFHLHFLNDAKDFGGHCLTFTTGDDVKAHLDLCNKLIVYIPDDEDGRAANLNIDRSAQVQSVNRAK